MLERDADHNISMMDNACIVLAAGRACPTLTFRRGQACLARRLTVIAVAIGCHIVQLVFTAQHLAAITRQRRPVDLRTTTGW